MKFLLIIFLLSFQILFGQTETKETRKTVNKANGDTTVSQSLVISKSEDITPRSNLVVINPLKFFLFYNLTYFHKVEEGTAIGIGFQIPTLSGINGFGINAEVRIYPSGKNLRGFYLAPNFSYNHLTSAGVSVDPISLGILIGWQWFPGDEFAIGLGIGVDHYWGSVSNSRSDFGNYNGYVPAVRFDVGYGW